MELLGDLVEGLAIRPGLGFRCELGAPFAVAVPEERRHILLYAFASGGSWVALEAGDGAFRHGGGGRGAVIACCRFAYDESRAESLLGSLPPLLHLEARTCAGHAWALPLLDALERECRKGEPGHRPVARRLSQILFIRVLREILARESALPDLSALIGDPRWGARYARELDARAACLEPLLAP